MPHERESRIGQREIIAPKKDEGSARRFDRITFFNSTSVNVDWVSVMFRDEYGNPWYPMPIQTDPGPFSLGPIGPGMGTGIALNPHDDPQYPNSVFSALCTVSIGPLTYECTVEADQASHLMSATFHLSPSWDHSPQKVITGEAVMGNGVDTYQVTKINISDPKQMGY